MNNNSNNMRTKKKGYIILNGIRKTKQCYGLSTESAEQNVLKGLANVSRAILEGTEGWTYWPDMPPAAQNKWLDKVAETLQWDELQGGKVANLHSISAGEFSRALVGSLA